MNVTLRKQIQKLRDKIEYLKTLLNSKNKSLFILFCSSLFLLLFVRDILLVDFTKFIFLAVFLLSGICLNKSNFIYFIIFSFPFFIGLPAGFLFPLCFVFLVLKDFKSFLKKFTYILIPFCFTIIEIFLSYFYGTTSITNIIQLFSVLSIVSYFSVENFETLSVKKMIRLFCLGTLLCYFLIAIRYLYLSYWAVSNRIYLGTTYQLIFSKVRFGSIEVLINFIHKCDLYPKTVSMFLNDNANNVAFFCLLCVSFLLFMYKDNQTKKEKISSIVLISIFILFGIWTQSRTFLLILFVLFFIYFVLFPLSKKEYINMFIGLMVTAIIVLVFLIAAFNIPFVTNILLRFFENDAGGGRFDIFVQYFEVWIKNPLAVLFGFGLTSLNDATNIFISPHTNFLQVLCSYGVCGFLILVGNAFLLISNRFHKGTSLFVFVPLLVIITFTFTIQSMYPFHLMLAYIPALLFISNRAKVDNYIFNIGRVFSQKAEVTKTTNKNPEYFNLDV